MAAARGDQKPCTHSECSGTMQFGRELLPQTSATTIDGERGWVCSATPGHFQPASGRRPAEAARYSTPDARWDDDGGRAAVDDKPDNRSLTHASPEDLKRSANASHDSMVSTVMENGASGGKTRLRAVRKLHELIAALDSRLPQVLRVGEMSIAHAAAELRSEALKRIQELELVRVDDVSARRL